MFAERVSRAVRNDNFIFQRTSSLGNIRAIGRNHEAEARACNRIVRRAGLRRICYHGWETG
jgi:hypothetical protein